MSRTLGTWLIWTLAILYIQLTEAEVRFFCPSVESHFYPGVKPQDSLPPYVLNVTDQNGQLLRGYEPGEALHTSNYKIFLFNETHQ